jgi:hypothetical protein
MSGIMRQVEERLPNWLPLPFEEPAPRRRERRVDEADLYSKGEVVTFYPRQGVGSVRNRRGKLIPFDVCEVALAGDPREIEAGAAVGYDASCTSRGLRATRLKIY